MSYILEALKRAAEQREGGGAESPRPPAPQPVVTRARRGLWVVVAAVVLVNAAVLLAVFRASGPEPPLERTPPPATTTIADPPPQATLSLPPPPPRAPVTRQAGPGGRIVASTRAIGEAEAPAVERPRATPERVSPAPRPQLSPPPEQRTDAVARTVPVEPQFMPPLPPTVDRARLKLEVLVYSEVAAKRLVFINGRKYVEGDSIEGRLKVVEIKEDGVVLSDDGRSFTLR